MKTRHLIIAALPLACGLVVTLTARTVQRTDAVRLAPPGRSAAGTPGRKTATYYALEQRSSRVRTEFADGTTATAVRALDGDVATDLATDAGQPLNRVRFNRRDFATEAGGDTLALLTPGAEPLEAVADPSITPTLDWLNRQSHHFHTDGANAGAPLRWSRGMLRRAGMGGDEDDPDREVRAVETQWSDGLSARTRRVRLSPGATFDGKPVKGDVLVTSVKRGDAVLGTANYFVESRTYAWKIDGVTEGLISGKELGPRYGGWLFKPDMVWMNLQTLALYAWRADRPAAPARTGQATQVSAVASCPVAPAPKTRRRSLMTALVSVISPVLLASAPDAKDSAAAAPRGVPNDEGCDGLHWLDGTIYRYCCDIHDLCYEKYGCTSSTWWQVWTSWRCDRCNGEAVWCFAGGGTGHGPYVI
jgi:hypothetical protein